MARRIGESHVAEPDWRELYRCNDARSAVSVMTSIAAMGFQVDCAGFRGAPGCADTCGSAPDLGEPPYIIRVPADDLAVLAPVVKDIVAEQAEFDEALSRRLRSREHWRTNALLVVLLIVMTALGLLGWLQL